MTASTISSTALRHACASGAWRVEPALVEAVDAAVAAYEAVRAPFYTPNPVQSLGWIDEESFITCAKDGIPGIRVGDQCPLKSWIEETTWDDSKTNLAGNVESLELTGRELVVEVTASDGSLHHFHVRRDDATGELDAKSVAAAGTRTGPPPVRHYHIQSFLDHFEIPIPKDIAQTNPAIYQSNLARLDALELHVNRAA